MMPYASNNSPASTAVRASRRRAVLDLAPLELDCMNTLWPIGEGTVRDIRDRLAARRPRAYTTIMTIMDRLARKGIVERRKSGRAYIYRPHLTADEARAQALGQLIDGFFSGSKEALLAQLDSVVPAPVPDLASAPTQFPPPRAAAAAATTSGAPPANIVPAPASTEPEAPSPPVDEEFTDDRIDDTLL